MNQLLLESVSGITFDAIRILRYKICKGTGTLESFTECKKCEGSGLDEELIKNLYNTIPIKKTK